MKKILFIVLISIVIGLLASSILPRQEQPQAIPEPSVATTSTAPPQAPPSVHNHEAMDRVPAYYRTAPAANTLPPTLTPEAFTGNVRLAYEAAKQIPETLAQLPCYCHCDMSKGHKSLYSCFEDEHGANCGICIGEALMAHNLQRQGLKTAEIRDRVIKAYAKQSD